MNENSHVVLLRHPDEIDDPLTSILRSGARQLLAQAVEMEAEAFLAALEAEGLDLFYACLPVEYGVTGAREALPRDGD